MTDDINRLLAKRILAYLRPQKAALLFGARRVGKTVLLRKLSDNFAGKTLLLNGEDYDAQAMLAERSVANYRRLLTGVDLLVIDEAQNIPEIGQKIKLIVDEVPATRVVASGSSSFDLLNKTGEPLVGRSATFLLTPFSQTELAPQENALIMRQNLETRLLYGAYPEVTRIENPAEKIAYLRDLVNAYLLKDILAVEGIKNSGKMRDLLRLVALQLGSEITYEKLGNALGLSKNTVEKYLDLLHKVFIGYRLGAYSRNLRKEVRKTGKWYFYDNGIRNALIGNFQPLALRDDVGALWENYLIGERLKDCHNRGLHKEFYFWRTYDGQEIDLIEQDGEQLTACEFKWGARKTKLPPVFAETYPQAAYRVVHRDNYADFIGVSSQ